EHVVQRLEDLAAGGAKTLVGRLEAELVAPVDAESVDEVVQALEAGVQLGVGAGHGAVAVARRDAGGGARTVGAVTPVDGAGAGGSGRVARGLVRQLGILHPRAAGLARAEASASRDGDQPRA